MNIKKILHTACALAIAAAYIHTMVAAWGKVDPQATAISLQIASVPIGLILGVLSWMGIYHGVRLWWEWVNEDDLYPGA